MEATRNVEVAQKPPGPKTWAWSLNPALARFRLWCLTLSGSRFFPSQFECRALSRRRASSPSSTLPSRYTAVDCPALPTLLFGVMIFRKPSLDSASRRSSPLCQARTAGNDRAQFVVV